MSPSHSPALARRRWGDSKALLTKADYDLLIADNATGTVNGETKFLFVKGAFAYAHHFYRVLSRLEYVKSKRAAGEDALFGYYFDPRNNNGKPSLTNQTKENRQFYDTHLSALLTWMGYRVRREIRSYWNGQRAKARGNGPYTIHGVPGRFDMFTKQNVPYQLWLRSMKEFEREFPLAPIFSTVTINRSAPFLPHLDAKNEGGLACLMAFGKFTGGNLCLPRLRVAFRLRPGDLLIADNNREYHGNVGGIYGERISVVAYLRSMEP
jgi:hypothetical protein